MPANDPRDWAFDAAEEQREADERATKEAYEASVRNDERWSLLLLRLESVSVECGDFRHGLNERDPLNPSEGYSARVELAEKLARIEDAIAALMSLPGVRHAP